MELKKLSNKVGHLKQLDTLVNLGGKETEQKCVWWYLFLDAIASPSSYPCESVSESLIVSDFPSFSVTQC